MRKVEYHVTVICPFNYCRMDTDITKMRGMCLFDCKYADVGKEKTGETVRLADDSKEVKEYEQKYSHCYKQEG